VKNQKKTLDQLQIQLDVGRKKYEGLIERLQLRQTELGSIQSLLAQANDLQKRYAEWQKVRKESDRMSALAIRAADLEKKRASQVSVLEKNRGSLEQERTNLLAIRNKAAELEFVYPT